MELLWNSIKMDWFVLLPIFFCAIAVVAVALQRWSAYSKNKRDIQILIPRIQKELATNNLQGVINIAIHCGGVVGEVVEEAARIFADQKKGFSRSFDISASLAVRKMEKNLTVLGTIGGVAPFLGLFGTVFRILLTFDVMAKAGNQAAAVASGIGSALIATAFGLAVAIVAVICFNWFQSEVKHFEDDFQLIRLLFLSFVDSEDEVGAPVSTASSTSSIK